MHHCIVKSFCLELTFEAFAKQVSLLAKLFLPPLKSPIWLTANRVSPHQDMEVNTGGQREK